MRNKKVKANTEKPIYCKDLKITMDLLVMVERLIETKKLSDLIQGESIDITYEQQFKLMELLTELEPEAIGEMSPEEVALELGFFTMKLASLSSKGRALSVALPFLILSPDEILHQLEMFIRSYPSLGAELITKHSGLLLAPSKNTKTSAS